MLLTQLHPFCVAPSACQRMHILYVDDSGSVGNANERFFVLGGVAVFERGIFHLIQETDACIAAMRVGKIENVELHGTDMYNGGRGVWKRVRTRASREAHINSALSLLLTPRAAVKLFAVVVDKVAVSPLDPVELAFEEICNRFNLYIRRINSQLNENQRGLIIMDENKNEKPLQALARRFRVGGGRWGSFRCLAEVPLFVDSKSCRIVQLADLVAWSTFRKYEFQDGRFFDQLVPRFDSGDEVIHGLVHLRGRSTERCFCPACMTRELRDARDTGSTARA